MGEKLFFRVRQGFGDAQATEVIIEYQIAEFLRAAGDDRGSLPARSASSSAAIERGGLDLIFFFSATSQERPSVFGYAACSPVTTRGPES